MFTIFVMQSERYCKGQVLMPGKERTNLTDNQNESDIFIQNWES